MTRSRFKGKVAIVTGGSMGIGRSTVLQLVEEGAHVVTCARRKPKLDELEEASKKLSGSFTGHELDVGDTEAFARLINETAQQYGRLDVLVNNAPSVIGGMVVDQTLDQWRSNFGIGVDSVVGSGGIGIRSDFGSGGIGVRSDVGSGGIGVRSDVSRGSIGVPGDGDYSICGSGDYIVNDAAKLNSFYYGFLFL